MIQKKVIANSNDSLVTLITGFDELKEMFTEGKEFKNIEFDTKARSILDKMDPLIDELAILLMP